MQHSWEGSPGSYARTWRTHTRSKQIKSSRGRKGGGPQFGWDSAPSASSASVCWGRQSWRTAGYERTQSGCSTCCSNELLSAAAIIQELLLHVEDILPEGSRARGLLTPSSKYLYSLHALLGETAFTTTTYLWLQWLKKLWTRTGYNSHSHWLVYLHFGKNRGDIWMTQLPDSDVTIFPITSYSTDPSVGSIFPPASICKQLVAKFP